MFRSAVPGPANTGIAVYWDLHYDDFCIDIPLTCYGRHPTPRLTDVLHMQAGGRKILVVIRMLWYASYAAFVGFIRTWLICMLIRWPLSLNTVPFVGVIQTQLNRMLLS